MDSQIGSIRVVNAVLGTLCVLMGTVLWNVHSLLPNGNLRISFLDVGQGDATLIQGIRGTTVLIDGGPDSSILPALGSALPYSTRTLDLVILTHPDLDHLGGLVDVVQRYQVKLVLLSGAVGTSATYEAFLEELHARSIPITFARADADVRIDEEVILDVLFPRDGHDVRDAKPINNSSIVTRLSYGTVSVLITGDIEHETEQLLVERNELLSASILKVPHHGSKTSSTASFLNAVQPSIAILSVGEGNRYGHPHEEVVARYEALGSRIYRTDREGTISLICSPQKCTKKTSLLP